MAVLCAANTHLTLTLTFFVLLSKSVMSNCGVCLCSSSMAVETTSVESVCCVCLCGSSAAVEMTPTESLSTGSPVVDDVPAVLSLPADNAAEGRSERPVLSQLSYVNLCSQSDETISSEIPFMGSAQQMPDLPARRSAKLKVCGRPVSSGRGLPSAGNATIKCDTDTFSVCGKRKEGTAMESPVKIPTCDNNKSLSTSSSAKIPSISRYFSVADVDERCSSLSPPKLTSFWDELDAVSDRTDNLFPVNADDDPPFDGFGSDPRLDDLSDPSDVGFAEVRDSRYGAAWRRKLGHADGSQCDESDMDDRSRASEVTRSPSTVSEVDRHVELVDEDIQFSHASPRKQKHTAGKDVKLRCASLEKEHDNRGRGKSCRVATKGTKIDLPVTEQFCGSTQKSHGVSDNDSGCHAKSDNQKAAGELVRNTVAHHADREKSLSSCSDQKIHSKVDEDHAKPGRYHGIRTGTPRKRRNLALRDVPLSPRCVIDEDIEFNLASPQKLQGIPAGLKSNPPDHHVPSTTPPPKAHTPRRRQLFRSTTKCHIPTSASASGKSLAAMLPAAVVKLPRYTHQKQRLSADTPDNGACLC